MHSRSNKLFTNLIAVYVYTESEYVGIELNWLIARFTDGSIRRFLDGICDYGSYLAIFARNPIDENQPNDKKEAIYGRIVAHNLQKINNRWRDPDKAINKSVQLCKRNAMIERDKKKDDPSYL